MSRLEATARAHVPRASLEEAEGLERVELLTRARQELEDAITTAVDRLRREHGAGVAWIGGVTMRREPEWDTDDRVALRGTAWVDLPGAAP